jgi:nicotinamidase-related amidase
MKRLKGKKKIMFIIAGIVLLLIAAVAGRLIYLSHTTTGDPIDNYSNGKAALLVIDMQEDTLRVPQYKNSEELVQNINASIQYAVDHGFEVIYTKQEFSNLFDLLLSGGMYKANSKGASLSNQLLVKSDHIFSKLRTDVFSNREFEQYLISNRINTLYLVGADASACVYKTSLGGVNRGYHVVVLKDCLFSVNDKMLNKMLNKYEKAGIDVKSLNDFQKSSSTVNN